MKRKIIITMFMIFLLLMTVAGGLFLVRPHVIDLQRRESEKALLSLIESGQTQIEAFPAPAMEGKETVFAELGYDASMGEGETIDITGYGVISIPSIELKMPLVEGADSNSLRAAAGWYPESAEIGGAGNCVIVGHRMSGYGRHFNRLDELKAGDQITLCNAEGESFRYIVTGSEVIRPDSLMDNLQERDKNFNLTLVTYTPSHTGSHRLMVSAQLDTSVG